MKPSQLHTSTSTSTSRTAQCCQPVVLPHGRHSTGRQRPANYRPCQALSNSGDNNSTDSSTSPPAADARAPQQQQQQPGFAAAGVQPSLPTALAGVNWYCYCCLGLLFLTDLTPLGQWLLSSGTPNSSLTAFPARLAGLQWLVFVLPSLVWAQRSGWDLRKTLKLEPCSPRSYVTALAAGPLLWLAINAAVALRTGNFEQFTAALSGSLPTTAAAGATTLAGAADGAAVTPGMLLLGVGSDAGSGGISAQQVALLLLFSAVSPAVAEELLFRGLLLTAVQQRLGATDAVAVCGAMFALSHLDLQQFFLYCVLGGASGLAAVRSGSVGPAMVLHAAFNATAVGAGLLLHYW